jgi:hypothetical protein
MRLNETELMSPLQFCNLTVTVFLYSVRGYSSAEVRQNNPKEDKVYASKVDWTGYKSQRRNRLPCAVFGSLLLPVA